MLNKKYVFDALMNLKKTSMYLGNNWDYSQGRKKHQQQKIVKYIENIGVWWRFETPKMKLCIV